MAKKPAPPPTATPGEKPAKKSASRDGAAQAGEPGVEGRASARPDGATRASLEELLRSLFDDTEFRRWVRRDPDCHVIAAKLPGAGATLENLVHEATESMTRQGLVGAGFFERLVEKFPRREADIRHVAAAWAQAAAAQRADAPAQRAERVPLAGAVASPASASAGQPDVVAYVTWLRRQPTGLNLIGVAGGDMQLALDEVYVPLRFAHGRMGLHLHERRSKKQPDAMDDCRDTFGLPDLFARVHAHAILLGGAGTGKTTALRKLVQLCLPSLPGAKAVPTGPATLHLGGGYVPVFVPLRRFVRADRSLSTKLRQVVEELPRPKNLWVDILSFRPARA